jgi:hypothetical protein
MVILLHKYNNSISVIKFISVEMERGITVRYRQAIPAARTLSIFLCWQSGVLSTNYWEGHFNHAKKFTRRRFSMEGRRWRACKLLGSARYSRVSSSSAPRAWRPALAYVLLLNCLLLAAPRASPAGRTPPQLACPASRRSPGTRTRLRAATCSPQLALGRLGSYWILHAPLLGSASTRRLAAALQPIPASRRTLRHTRETSHSPLVTPRALTARARGGGRKVGSIRPGSRYAAPCHPVSRSLVASLRAAPGSRSWRKEAWLGWSLRRVNGSGRDGWDRSDFG